MGGFVARAEKVQVSDDDALARGLATLRDQLALAGKPPEKVQIVISYVETLKYDEGSYEFSFPMTVGPRYNPASVSPQDAKAVTPKYAPPETRAGHDLSLRVKLDAGVAIDASGELTDGTHIDGVVALRNAILARPDLFAGTMTEKLLVYALGRGLDHHDMPVVRAILRDAAAKDYRFSSLILGVVDSVPFQMRVKMEAQ